MEDNSKEFEFFLKLLKDVSDNYEVSKEYSDSVIENVMNRIHNQ